MSKTLSIILKLFEVARILAKVVFIVCIVGGVGCLIASVIYPIMGEMLEILVAEQGFDSPYVISACLITAIMFAGEAVSAFFAEKYFAQVLDAGTPFTLDGAKKCFRFGLVTAIASAAITVSSGMVISIALLFSPDAYSLNEDASGLLVTGILFIFMSVIF